VVKSESCINEVYLDADFDHNGCCDNYSNDIHQSQVEHDFDLADLVYVPA
jgi:hypothetical protein